VRVRRNLQVGITADRCTADDPARPDDAEIGVDGNRCRVGNDPVLGSLLPATAHRINGCPNAAALIVFHGITSPGEGQGDNLRGRPIRRSTCRMD